MKNRLEDFIPLIQNNETYLAEELDLSYNKISFKKAKELAKALKSNQTLKVLHLMNCKIYTGSVKQIAIALRRNKTLKKLYLSNNKMTDQGVQALAEALKVNKTLKVLDLSFNNKIRLDGFKALAEALKINRTLKSLFLSGDHIDRSCMKIFSEVLILNKKISFLVIGPYTHPLDQHALEKCALEKAAQEKNLIERIKILYQAFPDHLNEETLIALLSKKYSKETVTGILSFVLPKKIPTLFFSAAKTIAETCNNNWDPTKKLGFQGFRKETLDTLSPRLQTFFKHKKTYRRFEKTYFVEPEVTKKTETNKRKHSPEPEDAPVFKKRKLQSL